MTRIVLFTETNSLFGDHFLTTLATHPDLIVAGVVLREPGALCDYYTNDAETVDLTDKAAELGVRTLRSADVNTDEFIHTIRELEPDFFIVANYQLRLGDRLLKVPACDAINFHPSPLPKYAGLAPFYWMAENHETDGGVAAVRMTTGLDEGPLLAQQLLTLDGTDRSSTVQGGVGHGRP